MWFWLILLLGFLLAFGLGARAPRLSMVLSLALGLVGAAFFGERGEYNLALAMLLLFPLTLLAVVSMPGSPESEGVQRWARGLLFCCGIAATLAVSALMGALGLVFLLAIIAGLVRYALVSRRARAVALVTTLASSIRQNLPLASSLEAAAYGAGRQARLLRGVARVLSQGMPLHQAIAQTWPGCPTFLLATIESGEKLGQLPRALESLVQDLAHQSSEKQRLRPNNPLYLLLLLSILLFFVFLLSQKGLPLYLKMFAINNQELPTATKILASLTHYSHTLFGGGGLLLLLGLGLVLLDQFRSPRLQVFGGILRVIDWLRWHLPGLGWFERNNNLLRTVEVLHFSLRAGSPLPDAIGQTLSLDLNPAFRRRVERWKEAVSRGEGPATAARLAGLGAPLAWALDPETNPHQTLSSLATVESFYRSNYNHRLGVLTTLFWPLLHVILGLMVGFVCYALFSMIFQLSSFSLRL